MASSSRTAQLSLWREVAFKRHEVAKPVNRHLDFIQRRFDELDAGGFVWSKDSILTIFLQLGLPEGPHSPFTSVDEIIESRALLGFETSSREVKEVIRIEELRHKPHRVGLMDLPLEVFNNILEILDHLARLEGKEIEDKKRKGIVEISEAGDKQPYTTYLQKNSPILNTIQNFSLTSREIHQLCRPWLWRKVQFPSRLQAPLELWTKNILLKQGSLVRSLSFQLAEECSKPYGSVGRDPFYDNLTIDTDENHEWISPNNVKLLIDLCPNISTLSMDYGYHEEPGEEGGIEDFLSTLAPRISSLQQLRELIIVDGMERNVSIEFPSKLIGSLPLLESLTCSGIAVSVDHQRLGDDSFGFNLCQLKSLSKLHLKEIEGMNESWCHYDWPKKITHLTIDCCSNLSTSSAHRIIQHIAPFLKHLKLYFDQGDGSWQIDTSWKPGTRFSLPSLTDLQLRTRNEHLLDSFQDCTSLRCLAWIYITLEHCKTLRENVLKPTWPQLKKLVVQPNHYLPHNAQEPPRQLIKDELILMYKYCDRAQIQAIIQKRRR